MDCCVQGRAGVPVGQLRRLAALAVTGVRGWGDRVEEHMSYAWLQMLTRAKEEQRRHLGEVGGVVDVDAEEGEGEGDDASSMQSSRSGGSKGKVGRPRKAPKLPAKSGGQPLAAQPPPAAHVDAWVAAQAGAMPEWQKQAVAAEGEVLLLRGKLQERSGSGTCCGRRPANPSPSRGSSRRWGERGGGGGAAAGGRVSDGVKYLMAGSQASKSQAEKVKGELSAVAATARLLLGQKEGGGGLSFESVVPGYKAALDSHDAVEKRYPGDALVEAATNPAFKPPTPAEAQGSGSSIGTASQ